eukprot:jgi/Picre1/35662/NNA_003123.t1
MTDVRLKKLLMQRSTVYKDIPTDVVEELGKLAKDMGLETKKLVGLFDKFMTVSRQSNTSVCLEDVDAFAREQAVLLSKSKAKSVFAKTEWDEMDVGKKVPDVNAMGAQKISPYVARSNALSDRIESSFESHNGCLQSVFNAELEFEGDSNGQGISEVEILNKKCQSTYMMNTLSRRVGYLEQRILSMEEGIEKMHDCKVHSIASACQDMALFCGRICCDTEGSRLNPQSVILEGSIATSKGARVRLDLSSCSEYRIFPGQIVAVRGKNPTGFCIVAEQMLSTLPFTVDRNATTKAFSMVVASGPFTAADNLMYEPLKALIQYCEREKPEVLLLLGPFVDEDHPDIGRGLIDGPLSVPDHPKTLGISNPSTIRYKGTVLGCSSIDWLMSSTREEISKSSGPVDRMTSLASQILSQRSYYPMYPPAENVALDVGRSNTLELVALPEILLTPSELAAFAKPTTIQSRRLDSDHSGKNLTENCEEVICINPGRLTKGSTAGTFAHVYINQKASIEESICKRCKVEIRKL